MAGLSGPGKSSRWQCVPLLISPETSGTGTVRTVSLRFPFSVCGPSCPAYLAGYFPWWAKLPSPFSAFMECWGGGPSEPSPPWEAAWMWPASPQPTCSSWVTLPRALGGPGLSCSSLPVVVAPSQPFDVPSGSLALCQTALGGVGPQQGPESIHWSKAPG